MLTQRLSFVLMLSAAKHGLATKRTLTVSASSLSMALFTSSVSITTPLPMRDAGSGMNDAYHAHDPYPLE